jgi:hypothetical protein
MSFKKTLSNYIIGPLFGGREKCGCCRAKPATYRLIDTCNVKRPVVPLDGTSNEIWTLTFFYGENKKPVYYKYFSDGGTRKMKYFSCDSCMTQDILALGLFEHEARFYDYAGWQELKSLTWDMWFR